MDNSGDTLDSLYNPTALYGMPFGFAHSAPQGVTSIMQDGVGRILLTGVDGSGGWVQRYLAGDSGNIDVSFGINGVILSEMSNCTAIAQQTLGRYIVAGTRSGNGVLRAYTLDGLLDITFNATGDIPGEYNIGMANGLYNIVVDQYDRIYIAYKNITAASPEYGINIARLASNGYLDSQFNSTGIILNAIVHADDASQIRIAIDAFSNVVVAAHINDGVNKIAIVAYDTTGVLVYNQLNIIYFSDPVLTSFVAKTDGNTVLGGYQSGNNPMWVARVTSTGTLDPSFGNGTYTGVMLFNVATAIQTARVLQGLSVRYDGQLSEVGYELVGGVKTPYVARSYASPYQQAIPVTPNQKPIGTIDQTLGKSGVPVSIIMMNQEYEKYKQEVLNFREGLRSTTSNGIIYFGSPGADAACNQVAQAIAMQDTNTYVIALDGSTVDTGPSKILINEYDVNGALVVAFNGTGQAEVPQYYENEYVRDMVTFTTTTAIHKAILVGYVTNSALGSTNSIVLQYNLSTPGLDTGFGGFNGTPQGIAFNGGKEAHVVGMQSNSRIIVAGLDQAGNGLVFGYTSAGKIDNSFGTNGSGAFTQGTTGIYTHAIDTQNRIIIAYNNGSNKVAVARFLADGSGLDTSFNSTGTVPGIINDADSISGISGNTNMKISIDSNNQVLVAAVVGTAFVIYRYYPNGTITMGSSIQQQLTIAAASIGGIDGSSIYTISKLMINTEDKAIITGYDAYPTPNLLVIMQTTANLSGLDTTIFNSPNGYITYQVSTGYTQVITDSLIDPTGRIVSVGWED